MSPVLVTVSGNKTVFSCTQWAAKHDPIVCREVVQFHTLKASAMGQETPAYVFEALWEGHGSETSAFIEEPFADPPHRRLLEVQPLHSRIGLPRQWVQF